MTSAAGPQSWMTRSSGVVGPQGCPGHYSLRFPNDMVEVIDGLLQMGFGTPIRMNTCMHKKIYMYELPDSTNQVSKN